MRKNGARKRGGGRGAKKKLNSARDGMSLKIAKQLYTKKKKFLNGYIKYAQKLLVNHSVTDTVWLEEALRELSDAWDVFDAAYDGLVKIKDKTQAVVEERDSFKAYIEDYMWDLHDAREERHVTMHSRQVKTC